MMKRKIPVLMLLAALGATPAWADWDAAGEAREAAARKAEAARSAQQKAEGDRVRREAEMKAARGYLGPAAQGKSDAEVKRMYDEKMGVIQRAGKGDAAARTQLQGLTPEQAAQMDATMKGATGKTLSEMNRMSDKEMDAFTRDMQKKSGAK